MKLRIRGDSIRLRLKISEVNRLAAGESIIEETRFPDSVLTYRLDVSGNDGIEAKFGDGSLVISLPRADAEDWAGSNKVSLFAEQDTGDAGTLSLLIEKDFKCLEPGHHREYSDDEDTFAHPSAQMDGEAHDMRRADFLVSKAELGKQEFRDSGARAELDEGQVRLRVDKFALTSNNVTYAAFGDVMQYWNFFPTEDDTFGRVPVWGFAVVDESRCEGVNCGERIYGFLPMSTEFVVTPVSISAGGFADGVEHRKDLHMVYNQYTRVAGDPAYDPAREAQQMILRPLFMTSYLIECFLRDNDYFSSERVILSSASSKTAIGVAFQIANSEARSVELVGLTSAANQAFVRELGLYDAVLTYDDVESLGTGVPTAFVDMAGNSAVLRRLHAHLNDSLKYSCLVGASHWDANLPPEALAGPKPKWFFAPAQFQERAAEAGTAAVLQQFSIAWRDFVRSTDEWMQVTELQGEAAIQQTFNQLLSGSAPPSNAYILSF